MAVTAPEDRRFRRGRATTPPAEAAQGRALGARPARRDVGRVRRGARARGLGRDVPPRPACASDGSSCRATCTCRRARCCRCSTACWASRCCAPTSRRGATRLEQSPWVADAVAAALVAGRRSRSTSSSGSRSRSAGWRSTSCWSTRDGVVIDEYGPRYEVFDLPIVDGLALASGSAGHALAGTAGASRRHACSRDLSGDRALLAQGVAGGRVATRTNVVVWLEGDHARLLLGRSRLPRAARVVPGRAAVAAWRASARWTTSTCGSATRVFVRPADGLAIGADARPGAGVARAPS